jgi:hypothetical protein
MLTAASLALEAAIVPWSISLLLPAADLTTCHEVALIVPQVATLFLTIRLIVRTLAHVPTVSQATLKMIPINLATSLGVSCLVAKKWLMIPSWSISKAAKARARNRSSRQWITVWRMFHRSCLSLMIVIQLISQ